VRAWLRDWWNYPFAVAGPASVLLWTSVAGVGVAGILILHQPREWLPGLVALAVGWLGLRQARHRFMRRREIAPVGFRARRRHEIAGVIAAVAALAIVIVFHLNQAWAVPLFAVFCLLLEIDQRQTWTRRGRPGDPRWARDWSPEIDPVYDLRAIPPMQAKEYAEAQPLLERGLQQGLQGWRLSTALYHLACIEALSGEQDAALEHLNAAVAVDDGLVPVRKLAQEDKDFVSIRDDPRFPVAESP